MAEEYAEKVEPVETFREGWPANVDSDASEDVDSEAVDYPEPVPAASIVHDRGVINLYGKNSVVNIYL